MLEVSVAVSPGLSVVEPVTVIAGVAGGTHPLLVTTRSLELAVHPFELLTVTLYVPGLLTTMLCVVNPPVHK